MKFHDILIAEDVVILDALALEFAMAPNLGKLHFLSKILMQLLGGIMNGGANG